MIFSIGIYVFLLFSKLLSLVLRFTVFDEILFFVLVLDLFLKELSLFKISGPSIMFEFDAAIFMPILLQFCCNHPFLRFAAGAHRAGMRTDSIEIYSD